MRRHVVLALCLGPSYAFGCKQVVASLAFVDGPDSFPPVIAEEAVHDAFLVHAGNDEPLYVWEQRYPYRRGLAPGIAVHDGHWPGEIVGCTPRVKQRAYRAHDGTGCPLGWQADVDESRDGLDAIFVLGMVEEESLAPLICGMPLEDIELLCPHCGQTPTPQRTNFCRQ